MGLVPLCYRICSVFDKNIFNLVFACNKSSIVCLGKTVFRDLGLSTVSHAYMLCLWIPLYCKSKMHFEMQYFRLYGCIPVRGIHGEQANKRT